MKKVIIIDTSILCIWLKIPGKETCGSGKKTIDFENVQQKIELAKSEQALLVLPLAVIIETGNHISQAKGDMHAVSLSFCDLINKSIEETSPWAAFSQQSELWNGGNLKDLLQRWQEKVNTHHSFGDASIVEVAQFYSNISNTKVEIYTGDEGLKSYQPISKEETYVPRRRR